MACSLTCACMHTIHAAAVLTIEYVPRNTILGTSGLNHRWLIRVRDELYEGLLLRYGITLYGEQVDLILHSEIMALEWNRYRELEMRVGGIEIVCVSIDRYVYDRCSHSVLHARRYDVPRLIKVVVPAMLSHHI